MKTKDDLKDLIRRIDGRGYKAYKDLEGEYNFGEYYLHVDHVQGDPYASPSRIRVRISQKISGFPEDIYQNRSREIAARDFLTRKFFQAAERYCRGNRGTGKSGKIAIDGPGQEILERTSVFISKTEVEARFTMGLPAFGRRIAGRHAESMFFDELPRIIPASLFYRSLKSHEIYLHVKTAEDADFLRDQLQNLGLVAFVAEGAILPRASGIDAYPLTLGKVVAFSSPESLRIEVRLPHRGQMTGMGIPKGVSLIVGGGYHGKSTLLKAIELGIYNHIPGDGREYVVTHPEAIKIRAEDGRRIERVDISPFISNLPFQQSTRAFVSEDASGSTSQAANTIEALEVGAKVLLIDEDTSATNFMIRDHRMQELVAKEKEPITPFIDKIRQLYQDKDVSTSLVIGGSGEYFDVADHVICMVEYKPYDLSNQARAIALKYQSERQQEGGDSFGGITPRIPQAYSFDPQKGRKPVKISARGLKSIQFGLHHIDLGALEQLVDDSQTNAIGDALYYAVKYMDGQRTLREVLALVLADIRAQGLDALSSRWEGNHAAFRGLELAAALNRLRSLKVKQAQPSSSTNLNS